MEAKKALHNLIVLICGRVLFFNFKVSAVVCIQLHKPHIGNFKITNKPLKWNKGEDYFYFYKLACLNIY